MQRFRSLSPCLIKASLLNYWGRLKIAKARVYVPRQPPQPVRTGNWACGQHMWKTHLLLSLLPLMNLLHDTKTFQPLLPSTDSNETCWESAQEESHARWESGCSSRAQWCSFPESNACWHGCWETGHVKGDAPQVHKSCLLSHVLKQNVNVLAAAVLLLFNSGRFLCRCVHRDT